jgi:hypothetical protein
MSLKPLNVISVAEINEGLEIEKIAAHAGPRETSSAALQAVYFTYRDMKLLGFFRSVYGRFGDRDAGMKGSRTYDIFDADTGNGRLFFVVDVSSGALDAFLDDGLVAFKLRDWLAESCRQVVGVPRDQARDAWETAIYGGNTMLPPRVRAIPFYSADFAPGVPTLTLAIVKT